MVRQAEVYLYNRLAGILTEDETGYTFRYLDSYLESGNPIPVSRLLPLQSQSFHDRALFPFFDGLIPEGWLLEIAEQIRQPTRRKLVRGTRRTSGQSRLRSHRKEIRRLSKTAAE